MKMVRLVVFITFLTTELNSQIFAFSNESVLLEARVIVDQPAIFRLATDWQMHLDRITQIYEFDKSTKSYAELQKILGNEKSFLHENLKLNHKDKLSALLKSISAKQSWQNLKIVPPKWTVVKNPDGSLDVAFCVYGEDATKRTFYRFKSDDPLYSEIYELTDSSSFKGKKLIAPLFGCSKFVELFTESRIVHLSK